MRHINKINFTLFRMLIATPKTMYKPRLAYQSRRPWDEKETCLFYVHVIIILAMDLVLPFNEMLFWFYVEYIVRIPESGDGAHYLLRNVAGDFSMLHHLLYSSRDLFQPCSLLAGSLKCEEGKNS